MNRIKNLTRLFIFVFALVGINILNVFALDTKISFSDPSTKVGEEFTVKMKVTSLDGAKLGNVDIMLSYDAGKIEFVSAEAVEGGAGSLKVSALAQSSTEWEYNLKFKALEAGDAKISITSEEVYDSDGRSATISHKGSSAIKVEGNGVAETVEQPSSETVAEETESAVEEIESTEASVEDDLYTKLSVAGKTVSIIEIPADVDLPSGLTESIVEVNGTRVKAWLDASAENKEYVVVYAKNDNEEAGFYSYDLNEKTLQRYFTGESIKKAENKYASLNKKYKIVLYSLIASVALLILAVVAIVYLLTNTKKRLVKKSSSIDRERVTKRIERNKKLAKEFLDDKLETKLDDDFSEV